MLPPGLFSTYQQYKRDTDVVASWLASTALACGYPANLLNSTKSVSAPFSGRLKGKGRKEAKRAGQKPAPQKSSKREIAIADFVNLAEFIASSKSPAASVPLLFSTALDRVITLRSSFGERMAEEGVETNPESDKKHLYFVGVLESVRNTFKLPAPTAQSDESSFVNSFGGLKVYEPSEAFLNAPNPSKHDSTDAPIIDATYRAEQSTALEEVVVAWTMMINDLTRLRSRIRWIWSNHRDGFFDAAAAALATNTAIDLARNIIDEVLPLTKDHGGCWNMAFAFHFSQCLARGIQPRVEGPDNFNYEAYDIASDTLIAAYRMLEAFLDVLHPKQLPLFKEGHFGIYNPASNRGAKSGKQKANEDKILMMQFFAEQMTIIRCVPGYPVEDEFLRGMRELDQTRNVPLYLAFAAQVHLDIHHVLRTHAVNASKTLLVNLELLQEELLGHLEFHKDLKIINWPARNDRELQSLEKEICWVQSDPLEDVKAKQLMKMGFPRRQSPEPPQSLLSWSPILAGLMLFRFRAHVWHLGIAINQAWGSILYTAHLYNALQAERALKSDQHWLDMDVVQTIFGIEKFYVGDVPKTRPEYRSKFHLSIGVSAAASSQRNSKKKNNGGRKVAIESKAGPRSLEGNAPVSKMCFPRYLEHSGQLEWTPEHVNGIIARSEWEEQDPKDGDGLLLVQSTPQETKARQKKAARDGPLSPSELVRSLALSLQAESMELSFLYLKMHRECWELLRAVKNACDPVLRRLYTPKYLETESQLPFVVGWIFDSLDGGCGAADADSLLRGAAGAVEGMIARGEGDAVCRVLQEKVGFVMSFEDESEDEDSP